MASDIWEIILACAESSFIEVTVFVGGILLLFGYINFKQQGDFQQTIEKSSNAESKKQAWSQAKSSQMKPGRLFQLQ
jgi:hypothetical protein